MNQLPEMHIMLDLETCALEENSAILSICLMPFSLDNDSTVPEPFYQVVDTMSCFMAGMSLGSSQEWWTRQDAAAKITLLKAEKVSVDTAFRNVHSYLSALAENHTLVIWSRGLNFDLPKLEYCLHRFVEKPLPYNYWNVADVRTALRMADINHHDFEFVGTKHNALDDCRHQIKLVKAAFDKVKSLRSKV